MRPSFLIIFSLFFLSKLNAQSLGIEVKFSINEKSIIYLKDTGKQISYEEAKKLINSNPIKKYIYEPIYDEYGLINSFNLMEIEATDDQNKLRYTYSEKDKLKIGQKLPAFIMKDVDNQEYKSELLKGKPIILGFYLSLKEPFLNSQSIINLQKVMEDFEGKVIPFMISNENAASIKKLNLSLPFIPIPNSYGFIKKYAIENFPSFVIVDKDGLISHIINGFEVDELKKAISKLIH